MIQVALTDEWQTLSVSGTRAIVQGTQGEVYVGSTAVTDTSPGLVLGNGYPIYIDLSVFTVVAVKGQGVARVAYA